MNLALNTIENKQQVWENVRKAVDKPIASSGWLMNWRGLNVAASVMLILAIGLLFYTFSDQQTADTIYQASSVAKTVSLADRSEIVISPNSTITVEKNYGVVSRKIHLSGSAQFSVIHNAAKPFIVEVDQLHIKDLGTVFRVEKSTNDNSILIGVTEGEVEVSDDFGYSKILKAGEVAIYNHSENKPDKQSEKELNNQSEKKLHPINFEPAKEPEVPEVKENNTAIQVPDTTRKKNVGVQVSTSTSVSSSSGKNGYSHSYSSSYALDKSYAPQSQQELIDRANKTTKRILADMLKEGLIKDDKNVSFKLSNDGFFINGEKQSEVVFQQYKKKYNPEINTNGEWSWTYNSKD